MFTCDFVDRKNFESPITSSRRNTYKCANVRSLNKMKILSKMLKILHTLRFNGELYVWASVAFQEQFVPGTTVNIQLPLQQKNAYAFPRGRNCVF